MTASTTRPRAEALAADTQALPAPIDRSITDIVDDLIQRNFETKSLLGAIDQRFCEDIAERASLSGDDRFIAEVDTISALITMLQREVVYNGEQLNEHYSDFVLADRAVDPLPVDRPGPLLQFVRSARRLAFSAVMKRLEAANAVVNAVNGDDETAIDAAVDAQTAVLIEMLKTHAGDIGQVRCKLTAIIKEHGDLTFGDQPALKPVLDDLLRLELGA